MDTCRLKGILSLIAATLLFSVMIVFAKLATQSLPATEVPVARYAFGLVAIIAASKILKFDLVGRDKKLLFLSGLTGSIGAYLFILALGYAPLGVVVVISFTFPVFAAITDISACQWSGVDITTASMSSRSIISRKSV